MEGHSAKVFCDHCQRFVGRSTYYRHRARYYDQRGKAWICHNQEKTDSSSDSDDSRSVSVVSPVDSIDTADNIDTEEHVQQGVIHSCKA